MPSPSFLAGTTELVSAELSSCLLLHSCVHCIIVTPAPRRHCHLHNSTLLHSTTLAARVSIGIQRRPRVKSFRTDTQCALPSNTYASYAITMLSLAFIASPREEEEGCIWLPQRSPSSLAAPLQGHDQRGLGLHPPLPPPPPPPLPLPRRLPTLTTPTTPFSLS